MHKRKSLITEIISLLFIMLFVYAASSKFMEFDKFQIQIGQSPLLTPFVGLVSWIIPTIEIIISILLVSSKTRAAGLYASFTLMVLFSFYIYAITRYSYFIPCSCGGVLQHMTWNQHLVFNLFFVFLAITGLLLEDSDQLFIAIKNRVNRKPVKE